MAETFKLKLTYDGKWDLPFSEAIAAATARGVVLPEQYYGTLQGIARQLSFSVAGMASLDQLQQVKDSLDKAIGEGQSFNQWKKSVEGMGFGLPKHRLDNIFRTNLQGQYMAGKWEQFERNKEGRPYLMYDAINDSRVRPAHLALDGIIRPVDDAFWRTHSAPNGYRCRCSLLSLSEKQAQARSGPDKGLNKQAVLPDGSPAEPDKGWDYSPRERLSGVERALDNRKGKSNGVLLSALKSKSDAEMKIITLPGFDKVQGKITKIAATNPDWFPYGFNGIHAVSNHDMFAGFDPATGVFYVSIAEELLPGFSPANELMGAIESIKNKVALTFNNEYAIETVWHEITHGRTGIISAIHPLNIEPIKEGVVQVIARHGYPILLNALGGKPAHQAQVIKFGLAYPNVTRNLIYLLNKANIEPGSVIDLVKDGNFYQLKALIAERLSISPNKAGYLLNQAEAKPLFDFESKVDVQIRNAQRNKGAS